MDLINSFKRLFSLQSYQALASKKRKLQSDILFESITILSLSIILIIGVSYYKNTNTIFNQAKEYIKDSSIVLKDKIVKALAETENAVNVYTPLLDNIELDKMNSNINIINSMASTLNTYTQLTTIYFGTPHGYFWEISSPSTVSAYMESLGSKLPEDTTSVVKVISHEENTNHNASPSLINEVNEQWYYVQDSKNVLPPRIGEKTGYDHRKRGWYIASSKAQSLQWSNIYVFATTLRGEAGITASRAIYDEKGVFKGVFAADITLKSFSEFLKQSKISPNSVSYVINEKFQIVANSLLKSNVIVKDYNYSLLTVKDLDDPALSAALNAYELDKGKENFIYFQVNNKEYIAAFEDFPKTFRNEWKALVIAPLDDFVAQIKDNRNDTLFYSLIILIIAFILDYRLARRISKPIITLAEEAKKIQDLNLDDKVLIKSRIKEISDLGEAISSLKTTMQAFSYYIPKALVRKLINRKQSIHVGGRVKEVTLMFTDIAGFTTVSENTSADRLVVHLSEYFEELTSIIMRADGTVDKYIGDAIMAFWGAPIPDRHHTFHACCAALACQKRLSELNRIWKREQRPIFNTRMGLHVGEVIIGNIGSSERMNYTAIGDSVNLSSRLEGLNKFYGTNIIVSETVYDLVKDSFLFRSLDRVAVKGKNRAVKIYELVAQTKGDDSALPNDAQLEFCEGFEKAYKLYLARRWKEALEIFEVLKAPNVNDISVKRYIERCTDFIKNPPPKDWDGETVMHEK